MKKEDFGGYLQKSFPIHIQAHYATKTEPPSYVKPIICPN